MKCGSCRYWEVSTHQPDFRNKHGDLYDPEDPENEDWATSQDIWGRCQRAREHGPQNKDDLFFVADASTYAATLWSRAEFGCVEWAEREER